MLSGSGTYVLPDYSYFSDKVQKERSSISRAGSSVLLTNKHSKNTLQRKMPRQERGVSVSKTYHLFIRLKSMFCL